MKTSLRILSTLCLSAILVACSSSPSSGLGQLPPTQYNDLDKLLLQADKKSDTQALGLYLAAADLAWQQQQALRAREILEKIDLSIATPAQQIFAKTLEAELALDRKQAKSALKALQHPSFTHIGEMPLNQQIRSQLARAQALQDTGKPLAAARERIFIAPLLDSEKALENHQRIWQLLSDLPRTQLGDSGQADLDGWLALVRITKATDSLEQQQANIKQWVLSNPQHPAAQQLPDVLQKLQNLHAQSIKTLALLLPSQDPNQNVVTALRNGFFAAHYIAQANGQATPAIRLYDSSTITSIDAFYQQAAADGVELVVGPWEKPLVRQLANRAQLPITTLALNYADNEQQAPEQLFQYGLAAEDEARLAADRAWADGMRRAAALVPQNAWGDRILAAFTAHWTSLGGVFVAAKHIDQPTELAGQIADLFELRASEQRAKQLEATLDTKLAAQPARRQDIDFIFLAATPEQARQIKPTLTFQYAGDVPIYATSAVNSGAATTYPELDGLQFSEMPWFIESNDATRQHITYNWPQASGSMGRFYAMGADAYQLVNQLQQLRTLPNSSAAGLTGVLKLNQQQRIERTLYWVQFTGNSIQQLSETQSD
ncbi:penicillin-binding protein activator [Pseudomonas sp. C27(2019)]|uniref:penicillin-binding protein activator n=1 Tax=Pseudomonas sp. C27(2019) TaxID=2604941 RepID=UPI001246FACF|nr:penicillin-binding protein activator [Pseudomonas sp. C27(2019)]QEY59654.1 penicillin-binding protein activator [Pseudomonas sp. C27(2019)]